MDGRSRRCYFSHVARTYNTARQSADGTVEPGLLDYLRILWRHKLLIIVTFVICIGAMVGIDTKRTKVYAGTADVLFNLQGSQASTGATVPVTTDLQVVTSQPVQDVVARTLHVATAPKAAVTEVGTTNVAAITVRSTSPTAAAAAANAYAHAYIAVQTQQFVNAELATEHQIQTKITSLQTQVTTLNNELNGTSVPKSGSVPPSITDLQDQLTNLYSQIAYLQQQLGQVQLVAAQYSTAGQLVTPAQVPTAPASPKKTEDALLAGIVGLLLGIGLALLRDHFDDRLRNADDLEAAADGLPAIGLVPALRDWRDRSAPLLISQTRPRSPSAEAYRTLRTSVQFMSLERPVRLLQVTSPAAAEGKTTTSANLAYVMAEAGQRVVLVDCDLRRPRIHSFFDVANDAGVTSVLLGEKTLDEALHTVAGHPNLRVLPSGAIPPNPAELLSSQQAEQLFQQLLADADVVVLDSSPVLPVTDSVALAARVDAVLLVAATGVSTRHAVTRSLELLARVDARVLGTVLNRAPEAASGYYRYGYGYGYGYGPEDLPVTANGSEASTGNGNGNGKSTGTVVLTSGNGVTRRGPAHSTRRHEDPDQTS